MLPLEPRKDIFACY